MPLLFDATSCSLYFNPTDCSLMEGACCPCDPPDPPDPCDLDPFKVLLKCPAPCTVSVTFSGSPIVSPHIPCCQCRQPEDFTAMIGGTSPIFGGGTAVGYGGPTNLNGTSPTQESGCDKSYELSTCDGFNISHTKSVSFSHDPVTGSVTVSVTSHGQITATGYPTIASLAGASFVIPNSAFPSCACDPSGLTALVQFADDLCHPGQGGAMYPKTEGPVWCQDCPLVPPPGPEPLCATQLGGHRQTVPEAFRITVTGLEGSGPGQGNCPCDCSVYNGVYYSYPGAAEGLICNPCSGLVMQPTLLYRPPLFGSPGGIRIDGFLNTSLFIPFTNGTDCDNIFPLTLDASDIGFPISLPCTPGTDFQVTVEALDFMPDTYPCYAIEDECACNCGNKITTMDITYNGISSMNPNNQSGVCSGVGPLSLFGGPAGAGSPNCSNFVTDPDLPCLGETREGPQPCRQVGEGTILGCTIGNCACCLSVAVTPTLIRVENLQANYDWIFPHNIPLDACGRLDCSNLPITVTSPNSINGLSITVTLS